MSRIVLGIVVTLLCGACTIAALYASDLQELYYFGYPEPDPVTNSHKEPELTGVVIDQNGVRTAGVTVVAREVNGTRVIRGVSGYLGKFAIKAGKKTGKFQVAIADGKSAGQFCIPGGRPAVLTVQLVDITGVAKRWQPAGEGFAICGAYNDWYHATGIPKLDGSFRVRAPLGQVSIWWSDYGANVEACGLEQIDTGAVSHVELEMQQPPVLAVSLVDQANEPVHSDFRLEYYDHQPAWQTTDENGRATLGPLVHPGRAVVVVDLDGPVKAIRELVDCRPGLTCKTIHLPAGFRLSRRNVDRS